MAKLSQSGRVLWLLTCEKGADFPLQMDGVRGRYQLPDGTVRWLIENGSDLDEQLKETPGILSIEVVER